ncbi:MULTISPECIES: ABC transporter permease [Paenarthrobacter]|uniref:ABC transporter permease n=1 Tax=Paenarthrobacter TaxID=1742992 RepID=UPI0018782827|nr:MULTISPECIES: ABC transporter permease [Paenarthrobacter]QOT15336.1 ABC transporter permease [Paenarthrobacter sp. YJN-5]UOD81168.1 ABC transporter permease [Paenarthrobacter ureafaciens]WNZ03828.1 ABC transporter permease [Paenarthrobacter ureafaciens]
MTTLKEPLQRPRLGAAEGELEQATTKRNRRTYLALLLPGLLGLLVSFVFPLAYMVRMSFNKGAPDGVIEETFTLDTYIQPLTDPYYWRVTLDTFQMGVTVGVLCVIVSYPVALFLARSTSKWRGLLIAIAIAPLLTSAVVRTYGWMVILGTNGLVNSTLADWGLIDTPLKLTNNMTGVTIGLVEIFMPYAILAMISGFGRLSPQLEEAAGSLGASKFRVFTRVTLPLSLPGILTAFLLVFVLSISTFITPRLLGGGSVQVLATEIYDQTTGLLNWPFAAALSVILLVLFGLIIAVYQRLTKKIGG